MSANLEFECLPMAIEQVLADVAVVFFFEDERPLRGGTGRADWRLCGALSELVAESRLSGGDQEASLIPTFGRLRAPRLLVLGLGDPNGFDAAACERACRAACERLLRLGISSAALAAPGDWMGALPQGVAAQAALRGAAAALKEHGGRLALRLVAPADRAARIRQSLEAAAGELVDRQLLIHIPRWDPSLGTPSQGPPPPRARDSRAPASAS